VGKVESGKKGRELKTETISNSLLEKQKEAQRIGNASPEKESLKNLSHGKKNTGGWWGGGGGGGGGMGKKST